MVETYKCKGCGAPIEFDGSAGELVCEYCGTHMSVAEMNSSSDKYDTKVEDETTKREQKIDVDGYRCSNCGAQLITDGNTTATVCSFCKSPAIIKERLSGQTMPAKIVPFSVTRDKAQELFKSWCKKGIFTPSEFKKSSFVESMSGIYVPFWLYDYDAECHMEAHATRVRHHIEGDYEVTNTDHFRVVRDGEASFHLIPADASEKMPDDVMDLLEPYNYTDLKDFQMPYLSGYLSEKYSYDSGQMAQRAENRVRGYIFKETRNSIVGYSTVNITGSSTRLRRKEAVYTLLPVWMITYRDKEENKMLAINGQTGKQVGELPRSKAKMLSWFGGIFAAVFAILMLLGVLVGGSKSGDDSYYDDMQLKVYDDADLFTDKEEEKLQKALVAAAKQAKLDLVTATIDYDTGEDTLLYASDFYDDNGFGYECEYGSGAILLIDMYNREVAISTSGECREYLDDETDYLIETIAPYLTDGDYIDGALCFVSEVKELALADSENFFTKFKNPLLDIAIALIIAVVAVLIMRTSSKTKTTVNEKTYMQGGHINLNVRHDQFTHTTTTRRRIQVDNGEHGGGGHGGGHMSSSGHSHGGSSGKF